MRRAEGALDRAYRRDAADGGGACRVFLTVLYARAGTGIISDRLARLVWLALRRLGSARGNSRVLSFCGPFIVVALLTWLFLLSGAVTQQSTSTLLLLSALNNVFLQGEGFERAQRRQSPRLAHSLRDDSACRKPASA
jgi:hypothetical protein